MDLKNIIVIIADKKLFDILAKELSTLGYRPFFYNGPSSLSQIDSKNIHAILDLSNNSDEELVKDFLDYAIYVKAKYIYGYKLKNRASPSVAFIKKMINDYKRYKGLKSVVLEIGDIYSPEILESEKLKEYIEAILENKPLKVVDDYQRQHLLHIDDFVSGVIEAVQQEYLGTYSIKNTDVITEIELANFLSELSDIEHKIEYVSAEPGKAKVELDIVLNTLPNWEQTVSLEEGFLELFEHYDIPSYLSIEDELIDEKVKMAQDTLSKKAIASQFKKPLRKEPQIDVYEEYEKAKRRNLNKVSKYRSPEIRLTPLKIGVLVSAFVLVLFALPSIFYVFNFFQAKTNITNAYKAFENHDFVLADKYSSKAVDYSDRLLRLPTPAKIMFLTLNLKSPVLNEFVNLYRNSGLLIERTSLGLLDDKHVSNVLGVNTIATTESNSVMYQVDKLSELDTVFQSDLEKYKKVLESNKDIFDGSSEFKSILNLLSADRQTKRFVIAIQDDSVLRPTGGKIVSLGVLSFTNGEIKLEKTIDINELNNQILSSGFSVKPAGINDFLPVNERSKFANLLFDPRFSEDAKKILEVMGYVSRDSFDGVILINENWLNDVLGVSDLNSVDSISIPKESFMVEVISGLGDGSIQMFSNDEKIEAKLLKNGWSTYIEPFDGDFVYVVDSNIGKVGLDSDIEKSIEYMGYDPLSEGSYRRTLTVGYTNNGSDGYTDNLNVFVPENVALASVSLIDNGEVKNIAKDVSVKPFLNKTLFDVDLYVETQHTVKVKFTYESKRNVLNDDVLNFRIQKQPGSKYSYFKFYLDGDNVDTYNFDKDLDISVPLFRLAKQGT